MPFTEAQWIEILKVAGITPNLSGPVKYTRRKWGKTTLADLVRVQKKMFRRGTLHYVEPNPFGGAA